MRGRYAIAVGRDDADLRGDVRCCGAIPKSPSKADEPYGDKHLLRRPYITGTGATVDKPGVPQASGTTKLDRQIRRQDNKIDNSICRGCRK